MLPVGYGEGQDVTVANSLARIYMIRPKDMLKPMTPIQSTSSASCRDQDLLDACLTFGKDHIETIDRTKLIIAMIK